MLIEKGKYVICQFGGSTCLLLQKFHKGSSNLIINIISHFEYINTDL